MAGTVFRGLSWSMVGALGQALLQIVALVVLARLVSVEEFGIAVAAAVVMSFTLMLSELGIGPSLVQARELDRTDIATAFYLAAAVGAVLAGCLIVLAPVLGPIVGLPADSSYLQLLSIAVVLGGLSAVAVGLLQRQMRFRELALVGLTSYGVGYLGTAVVLASAGAGAAALIWGQIVQALLAAIGYHVLVRPDVRPRRLGAMAASSRRILGFGSGYSLARFGNWIGVNGDNLVVASVLGPAALGIYSRAYQLLVQPANLIGTVADKVLFPSFSRMQDDGRRLARAYVLVNSLVAVLTIPGSVLLLVLAPELVDVLLGEEWSAVTLPLQIFAVVLLPRTAYKISGSLVRATGVVFRSAWRQWLYAAEILCGCWIGSHWGVVGVAVGASVAIVLHFTTMLVFSARVQRGIVGDVLRAYAKSLPAGIAMAAVCFPLAAALRGSAPDVVTLLGTAAAGVVTGGLALLGSRRLFREELATLRTARARPARSAPAPVPAPSGPTRL
ncbi:lipopolysaccharide biosynthesis protein [Geodermatophilus sp. DF01-2]|uniref:lipopolysaccharide biosynthesis protein n=1 Tax=Geodermatophilus sp. DF01-2 TaxID=2559610 RepID=UPI0010734F5E|nr:lipopolysaccharide biosynthesis protein [Geodermatophilus sp. DF01_2]TFV64670.1 lipopolysaccharide biosynthesis protein [Geodermatophilus sp. DF01_2]